MNNCVNCGKKRAGLEKFCTECGATFPEEVKEGSKETPVVSEEKRPEQPITPEGPKFHQEKQPRAKKKKVSKKKIVGLASIAIVAAGLTAGHLFLKSTYDTDNHIAEMNQAYVTGNHSAFLSSFTINEGITADEEGFYTYIEDEGWEYIRDQMKTEAEILKEGGLSNVIMDYDGNKLISVVNKPLLFGLYDRISFIVHPVKVTAELPLNDTTVDVGEQTVTGNAGEQVTVGEFLPGTYNWKATVPSEFSPIESEGTMEVDGDGDNIYLLTPEMEGGMVTLTSDIAEAVLVVNGKSTGQSVQETKSFGPVPFDGSVEVSAESKDDKGKVIKGEPVAISSDDAYIKFASVQEKIAADRLKQRETAQLQALKNEHEEGVTDFINAYRYDFEDALNYADFSYIASYFLTGSEAQLDYLTDIERHASISNYYQYDFESNVVTNVEAVDETTFKATTAEMFYFTSDGDNLRYNKTKVYTIELKNGYYYISNIKQLTSEKTSI